MRGTLPVFAYLYGNINIDAIQINSTIVIGVNISLSDPIIDEVLIFMSLG